jgi:hypothetical protein
VSLSGESIGPPASFSNILFSNTPTDTPLPRMAVHHAKCQLTEHATHTLCHLHVVATGRDRLADLALL